jgi:hypothetical protein
MSTPQQFLIYQSEDGATRIDVLLEAETLWLSQKQLTELFGKAKGTISEHIKHIFEDGEWTPETTVRLFRTVQTEGEREVTRELEHYNLDMVLALGFRVRSASARLCFWLAAALGALAARFGLFPRLLGPQPSRILRGQLLNYEQLWQRMPLFSRWHR